MEHAVSCLKRAHGRPSERPEAENEGWADAREVGCAARCEGQGGRKLKRAGWATAQAEKLRWRELRAHAGALR